MIPKLLVISYPAGAGGKFLANCLGLSKGCALQDKALIDCSYEDAWNEIQSRFPLPNKEWNDLNLGCLQLFGFFPTNDSEYPSYCRDDIYMPAMAHTEQELTALSGHTCINLINCSVIQEFRKCTVIKDLPTTHLEWDCEWFFDEQKTLNELYKIYEHLALTDFQKVIKYIKLYRLRWLEAIHG